MKCECGSKDMKKTVTKQNVLGRIAVEYRCKKCDKVQVEWVDEHEVLPKKMSKRTK
jgi:predicted SprT family Zn-dependent metalloprotease